MCDKWMKYRQINSFLSRNWHSDISTHEPCGTASPRFLFVGNLPTNSVCITHLLNVYYKLQDYIINDLQKYGVIHDTEYTEWYSFIILLLCLSWGHNIFLSTFSVTTANARGTIKKNISLSVAPHNLRFDKPCYSIRHSYVDSNLCSLCFR
jgi:hypothetical protein